MSEHRQKIGDVLASDVDGRVAGITALEAREQPESVPIDGGCERLPSERDARQKWHWRVDVEHGYGESTLANMHPELEIQAANCALGSEPCADPGGACAGIGCGNAESRRRGQLLNLNAPSSITPPTGLTVGGVLRQRGRSVVRPPRKLRARLIAHGNQQGRHMLAMLPRFLESRAGAHRSNAFAAEFDRGLVGLGIGPLDPTSS